MNAPSIDIKDLLLAESSFGFTFGTDLFVGIMPSDIDNNVTITDLSGGIPELILDGSGDYYRPLIHIKVRNNDYSDGYDLINNIKTFLHGQYKQVINGSTYTLIQCLIEPGFLEQDKNNRFKFVTTFNLQRK